MLFLDNSIPVRITTDNEHFVQQSVSQLFSVSILYFTFF